MATEVVNATELSKMSQTTLPIWEGRIGYAGRRRSSLRVHLGTRLLLDYRSAIQALFMVHDATLYAVNVSKNF